MGMNNSIFNEKECMKKIKEIRKNSSYKHPSFSKQIKTKGSPLRKVLSMCLNTWKKCKSTKETAKILKLNKKILSGLLLYSKSYQQRKHRSLRKRLRRQQERNKELNIKGSNYRNKVALYLKLWKKYRSITKITKFKKQPRCIIEELLNSSKKYKNRTKYNKKDISYASYWASKIWAINILKNKCQKCNSKDVLSLEFHHKSKRKEAGISNLIRKGMGKGKSFSSLKSEIKKCQLLCRNCHQELHHPNPKNIKHKKELMKINGSNQCCKCGYNKNVACIEFHHIDPKNKKLKISSLSDPRRTLKKLYEFKNEIKKCQVLCSNCHQKKHINKQKFKRLQFLIQIKARLLSYDHHAKF